MAIHPPYLVFYKLSISFCLQSAAASINLVADLIDEIERDNKGTASLDAVEPASVLNELQNVVLQGAAISRYFWPVNSKHQSRGEYLRKIYDVKDTSPLRSRDLRNAIEHFDEKLDNHLSHGIVGEIYPHYLGPEPRSTGVKRHYFRAYFLDTGVFQLLEHRFEIEPLAEEIWHLASKHTI